MLFSSIPVPVVAEGAGSTAPVCGLEEHRHTEECRQEDVLTCGKEEHVHTDDCYPAPEPAPETNEEPEPPAEEEPAEEPEQPSEPAAPEAPSQPAAPAEPETPAEPAAPAEPAQPEEPETPAQPAETEAPAQPEEPEEPETPEETDETAGPEETGEPAETEAPAESDKPEDKETPAAPSETEKPKATAKPEKTKAPEPVPEEKEEPVHFESGYVLIKSKTIAYTDIYQTAEKGTFIGYATAWAVSAQKAADPEQDWLQVTFDTEDAKVAGSSLLTGYIQASSVNALTEEEAQQLAAELEADPTVRKTGTHPLPVVGFELKEEPAAELTVEEVADPIAGPAEVPAETSEEGPEQEPAAEPDEDPAEEPAGEPEEGPADDPEGEQTGEPAEEPEGTPEDGTGESGEETGENPEDRTEESGEEPEEGPEGEDEEPGGENEENPEEETEDENGEETEVNPEEETEEEPEEPTEVTLSSEDAPYLVVLSFLSDAGIPEGTELVVTEADAESAALSTDSIASQKNAKKSMRMLSGSRNAKAAPAEPRVSILSLVSWNDGEEAPELILYRKTLDISLFADGEEIEPDEGTAVTVAVTLPGIEDGQDVEVVHMTKDGPVTLESTNDGGTVTFVTDSFSLFTFTSRARQIASMRTGLAETNFYGKTADRTIGPGTVALTDVTEGLEVLETCALPQDADLWTVLRMTGVPELGKAESLTLYAVNGNTLGGIVQENLSPYGNLRFNLGEMNSWALVKDTGYRHQTLSVNPEGAEAEQIITLDGLMPYGAEAEATDVTEQFAEYSPEEHTSDTQQEENTAGRTTLAAFDISIYHNNEEYQPDEEKPIRVEITDSRITAGRNIELWHIRDDGTKERVENFATEEGRISFEATGFSVYVVIDHEDETVVTPRVIFHFIADGAESVTEGTSSTVYYHGDPYSFTNKHGGIQTTQILSNGESLELIKDPDNELQRYFFGWYVVEPYVISGTTDKYGIGTNGELYYTWTAVPQSITFESPITIDESNINIDDTVNWSLNGVSGSGTVDSDGNAHVFLAPIFENYNFINFMLYPYAEGNDGSVSANNVMTRKLIPRGSSEQTDVKISDIRASSMDPVHLVFTGWQYNAGTDENPEWRVYQTVSYFGDELTDDGRDGVYLNVDLVDKSYVDLYPVFIEARWVDYFSGNSDSGATYVASCFRESWGEPGNEPAGMTPDPQRNIFTSMNVSTREGYDFEGWYAFAVRDRKTGKILNLTEPMDVTVSYIDINHKYTTLEVPVHTTAVKIANADGSIAYNGNCYLVPNGSTYTIGSSGSIPLFGAAGGQLKLYDALDRLSLSANWTPASSQITIIYWTENAQDIGYTAPAEEKDDYTASAVKVVTTDDLAAIGGTFDSGSTITLAQLAQYQEESVGVLDPAYLDNAGAVLAGEEKFYERNDALSDDEVVIKGDGSTTINVYYSRMVFKLAFHIGRDGYVKQNGQQKPEFMTRPEYANWDGNWIQFMFKDWKVNNSPSDPNKPGLGYTAGPTAQSYAGIFSMTYGGRTYTSEYVTNPANVMGGYVPGDDENVYVITAKYGAYIGDRWPTPVNSAFTFADPPNATKTMYIWAAYYGSLYCRIANERVTHGNTSGNNPDINGIYEYMSAELCSNREGTDVINDNHVLHLVAWFGDKGKAGINKHYHIYYAAIPGTYDPAEYPTTEPGNNYLTYNKTTWCTAEGQPGAMDRYSFYKVNDTDVISNLEPEYQLGSNLDGYELVYSCYRTPNTNNHHIYFFYVPKQYTLTFNLGNTTKNDTYYYTQTLAEADKYTDEVTVPEGYYFKGWYTNTAGAGDPFDFANETMPSQNLVLYPVVQVLQYTVKVDPNGGVIDHRANESQSTYFTADYGTPVGEYSTTRGYIKLTDKELDPQDTAHYYTGTKYYYINTQYLEIPSEGEWGLPTELRNAVYVAEDQIDTYYNWYSGIIDDLDENWWAGVRKLSRQEFIDTYTSQWYRPLAGAEHYTFMGWYQVYSNGSVASMPYNFNTPTTGPLELRALWRLDGGYYIQYVPTYYVDAGDGNVTAIIGNMPQWTDPDITTSQPYADQAPTNILQAPTLPESMADDWVFRGWRVVRPNGEQQYTYQDISGETISGTYPIWEPMQRVDPNDSSSDPVYYQPGDHFTIESDYVTAQGDFGGIIYMQAYYEPLDNSHRRPYITNLTLDANETYGRGYVNTDDSSELPALNDGAVSRIKTETDSLDTQGDPKQILFGDVQSNLALHLNQYATTEGRQYFTSRDGYLLLGFDENMDPNSPTTGKEFIPAFASDAVIAVTRNETDKILYAMWEPMVYVNFVNTTEKEITVKLSGTGADTVHVVNIATGEFDREQSTGTIIIPAKTGDENGVVRIVLPRATPGTDRIIATARNEHARRKINVSGEYPKGIPYGEGSSGITYGNNAVYTGTLVTDENGITVTYTEDLDAEILYNVNGGTWTDTDPYHNLSGDVYALDVGDISDNEYEPTEPTYPGKIFIGWTDNPDIAAVHDFSSAEAVSFGDITITPDEGGIILDKIRNEYLWDFSREASDLYDEDKTLYAVWSDAVTVTFDIAYSSNLTEMHNWNGPETTDLEKPYVYYRSSDASPYILYTMAKGECVPKPQDPTAISAKPTWSFLTWVIRNDKTDKYRNTVVPDTEYEYGRVNQNTFDFAHRVTDSVTLITSWTEKEPQTFTFKVVNNVVNGNNGDEFNYTIAVSGETIFAKRDGTGPNLVRTPDEDKLWGSVNATLKNGQEYTVRITVYKIHPSGWTSPAFSAVVEVVDEDGTIIKTGKLFRANKQKFDGYTSDYKYTLTVSQEERTDYTTTVTTEFPFGTVEDPETNNSDRSFTFYSCMSNSAGYENSFSPVMNPYDTENLTNGLTIVFTNTGAGVVAPTGITSIRTPFILMMLTGLLLAGFAVPGCLRKRRRAREDIGTEGRIPDPEMPQLGPRPKLLIQPRGPSRKRGGSG